MKCNRRALLILGLLCFAAALGLTGYNLSENSRAGAEAEAAALQLQTLLQSAPAENTLLNPAMEMPVRRIGGLDYIGIVEIPALQLRLPVVSRWSYPNLRRAPCRYSGSVYQNNLVLAGHNYPSHFGRLRALHIGDAVLFSDADGRTFSYAVSSLATISPTETETLPASGLTLFTCTPGGQHRLIVCCRPAES